MSDLEAAELPEGWVIAPVEQIAGIKLGKMLDRGRKSSAESLPYLRNINVRWGGFDLDELLEMPFEPGELEKYSLRTGDVLVCEGGEPGRAAVWETDGSPIKFQKALHRVRLYEQIDPRWLVHRLRFDADCGRLEEFFTGSTIKHFTRKSFARYTIPLPPVAEQWRIVGAVEGLLGRVNAARERLARLPAILKRFRQSVLAAACSGRLTEDWREQNPQNEDANHLLGTIREAVLDQFEKNRDRSKYEAVFEEFPPVPDDGLPSSWLSCRIGHVGFVCNGSTPSRKRPEFWGGDINWASSGEVQNNVIRQTRETITVDGFDDSSLRLLPAGTVLVAMIGEGKTRGQSAILAIESTINQNMAAVDLRHGQVLPEFLWYWFQYQYLRTREEGAGSGPQALNCQRVRELPFHLPPLDEQREVVRRIEGMLRVVDVIETRVAVATRRAEKLTQAILAQAFRGELVPTEAELAHREGRDYEPASALLERIRAEREAGEPPKPKKRSRGKTANPQPAVESAEENESPPELTSERPRPSPHDNGRSDAPPPIDETDRNEVLAVVREVFGAGGHRDRDTAIRDVAHALGYRRVGKRIRETLDNDLRTAVRRGILENGPDGLALLCRHVDEYETDHLIAMLLAAMGTTWWDEDDAIRATARHLGYRRAGRKIVAAMESAIRTAIRRGVLERDGDCLRRK